MSVRGVAKHGATTFTSRFTGMFPRQSGGAGAFPVHGARVAAVALADFARADVSTSADFNEIEEGLKLQPKFDASGLVTCVATDAGTGEVLMVAHMNDEALRKTIASGDAWYFSRSRNTLWRKRSDFRSHAAGRRNAGGLRSGRRLDPGRAVRRRLPHRPSFLLLSQGRCRRGWGRDCRS